MIKMETSTYLLLGTADDQKNPKRVYDGVTDAIIVMDEVARSYGVEFSEDVINRLQAELQKHDDKIKATKQNP